jgi:hypothetical protein
MEKPPPSAQNAVCLPGRLVTISALHHLVTKLEKELKYIEEALSAFVNIQGAIDNMGFESIRAAAVSRQIDPESVELIIGMLECRIVSPGLGEEQVKVAHQRLLPNKGIITSSVVTCYRYAPQRSRLTGV